MSTVTLDQVLDLARKLSPRDQARLVARLAPAIEYALEQPAASPTPRTPLRGRFANLGPAPSAEEIDEARREAWANFPHEDI
ncbi:MAG TPA: hypothetical protein VKE41_02005 [Roseiflexaceae bacterium]|nr:hypothetical protein [Roseiflexaceae bacterium]